MYKGSKIYEVRLITVHVLEFRNGKADLCLIEGKVT